MARSFIAVDGEGIDNRYVILAASTGQYISDVDGLSTIECLEFLLSLHRPTKATYVGFFFTYDVNMIIKDIPLPKLKKLWQDKWLYWRGYHLEWTPTKCIDIKRESPRRKVSIYDVGGFFQSSFVTALTKWEAAPPEVIERIRNMKEQRDVFSEKQFQEMLDYCLDECKHLVTLMQKLEVALATANLTPNKWMGAGSIAGKLLQRENVRLYRKPDTEWGDEVHSAILHSYFGGRVELFLQGYHQQACSYDITSAYPYAATMLPSLDGSFSQTDVVPEFGLCHVRWNLPDDTIISPFPFRHKKGVYWPAKGEGWYHACEVRSAREHYPNGIDVISSLAFRGSDPTAQPFGFLQSAFTDRAKFKRDGNPAEKALKLGTNSVYGKLAQGVGYRGKPPAHRSYLWAGFITAYCRATMFRLAMENPERVIMIATDGIFLTDDPKWQTGDNLGDLSKAEYPVLFTAQPGVYVSEGETVINKTRGFSVREIGFSALKESFDRAGPFGTTIYRSRRFQGLGSSLQRKTMDGWLSWPESERKLCLYPSRKTVLSYGDISEWRDNPRPHVRHHPPRLDGMSEQYVPKTPDAPDGPALDYMELQEQPDPGEAYHAKR